MKRAKIAALAKLALFLLVAFCAVTLPLANAQTNQTQGVPTGFVLVEGDMLLPESFVNALRQQKQSPNAPTATYQTNLWPNGIVPYEFDANVTATNQTDMLNAMAVLTNVANLNFQQCSNNSCSGNYVHIQNSTGNNSNIGMTGGQQVINIFDWGTRFIMVHELLHCLGFFHEQSRTDRDGYVQINNQNICTTCCPGGSSCNPQFIIQNTASIYGNYDFDSVMHYRQCAFSVNTSCPMASSLFPDGGITISVKAPYSTQWQAQIGQRDHLSVLDQATVSFLYPFPDWRFLDCTYNGSNGSPNGMFLRPYSNFAAAFANTPSGGTLWILQPCNYPAVGSYSKQITVRVAPGVIATLGG